MQLMTPFSHFCAPAHKSSGRANDRASQFPMRIGSMRTGSGLARQVVTGAILSPQIAGDAGQAGSE